LKGKENKTESKSPRQHSVKEKQTVISNIEQNTNNPKKPDSSRSTSGTTAPQKDINSNLNSNSKQNLNNNLTNVPYSKNK